MPLGQKPLGNKSTVTLERILAADLLQISAISAKENAFDTLFGCKSPETSGGEEAEIKSATVRVGGADAYMAG